MNRRQKGSIAISSAMFALVGVILLGSVALGYQFYLRRDVQKMADMSALAAAQALRGPDCTAAKAVGTGSAAANGQPDSMTITCGNWDSVNLYKPLPQPQPQGSTAIPNAVQVTAARNLVLVPKWMPSNSISATSVAIRALPTAVFSIDAQLMNSILGCIVGCGAIANVNLSMLSFLNALGITVPSGITVAGLKNLLSTTSPTYNQVLNAVGQVTQLNLGTSLSLNTGFGNNLISLLTLNATSRGLLTIDDSADAASVLAANLNALNLIEVAAGVANQKNAISTTLVVPGATDVRVGIIEPPSIAVGGVGTTAYSAQIRIYAQLSSTGIFAFAKVLSVLSALVLNINLQIAIDVADAKATLTSLCTSRDANNRDFATFSVSAPLLRVCVGHMDPNSIMSQTTDCSTNLTQQNVLTLLGLPLVSTGVNGLVIPALPNDNGPWNLEARQTITTTPNPLAAGTTLSMLTAAIGSVVSQLDPLLGLISSILQPTLNFVGGLVASTLNTLLRVNIGQSTLTLIDLNCIGQGVRLVQ
jgi:uncharacterized membrane protein